MAKDSLHSMLESLKVTKRDGDSYVIEDGWDLTMHGGRPGSMISIQQVTKITFCGEHLYAETHKGQRVTFWVDEIRGFTAEENPSETNKGRRTGFM